MVSDRTLQRVFGFSPQAVALWGNLVRALTLVVTLPVLAGLTGAYVPLVQNTIELRQGQDFGVFYDSAMSARGRRCSVSASGLTRSLHATDQHPVRTRRILTATHPPMVSDRTLQRVFGFSPQAVALWGNLVRALTLVVTLPVLAGLTGAYVPLVQNTIELRQGQDFGYPVVASQNRGNR